MLKQSDALIIFIVLAVIVGIFIITSNTAALVIVAGLELIVALILRQRAEDLLPLRQRSKDSKWTPKCVNQLYSDY